MANIPIDSKNNEFFEGVNNIPIQNADFKKPKDKFFSNNEYNYNRENLGTIEKDNSCGNIEKNLIKFDKPEKKENNFFPKLQNNLFIKIKNDKTQGIIKVY